MTRKQNEKRLIEIGLSLYKEKTVHFNGEVTMWYVAKNYIQYTGGSNKKRFFSNLQEIQAHYLL